jgi:superfamily II DNA/RNA helicase
VNSHLAKLPNTYRPFFGGFDSLTLAQKALIQPILNGKDVVLQAGTGSGKTEAVLAPATERLITSSEAFTILYIVPTRALALDIYRRIKPIYKHLDLKVGIRTGDGKTLQGGKPDLLILTPESLDVLLGSQDPDNKYFLKQLRLMIIDEVHIFLHEDRGYQLSYLRHRIAIQAGNHLQTILLSATIPNLEEAALFFKIRDVFYYKQDSTRELCPTWVHIEDQSEELLPFFEDLCQRLGYRKLLVFANTRKKCEELFELLNQSNIFAHNVRLHYSNLSTKERRAIESSFRTSKRSLCIATSTLEMGIDIGDVDGVVLIGPPPSTIAFLQRIGRGNRREQHIRCFGVCYGPHPHRHLLRFLALFMLAKDSKLEYHPVAQHYSILFQQILSCLYSKTLVSVSSITALFSEQAEDCEAIIQAMLSKQWLKPTAIPGLFQGGWRYLQALNQQKIWTNFPPTEEEYDVILEQEKIAVLPLSAVKNLEVGDLVQFTGKVLRVLFIEEKKASKEVWVEESQDSATKTLEWSGAGIPISFDVAQKIGEILLENTQNIQGLLKRTQRLLADEKKRMSSTQLLPNGIRVHRLGKRRFRYETFLGTFGNFIIHHQVNLQFSEIVSDFYLHFDELGIECSEWILFESLNLPYSASLFEAWIESNLALLKSSFLWNTWMRWLSQIQQRKEISSRLFDPRLLEHFEHYIKSKTPLSPPEYRMEDTEPTGIEIPLQGQPFSVEDEKEAWGHLDFPSIPTALNDSLSATQVQGYLTHKFCPRWSKFQQLNYNPPSHPRFQGNDQRLEGLIFKKHVTGALQNKHCIRWESRKFTWKNAVNEVISTQKPLFIAQAKLQLGDSLKGRPDLIYIKPQPTHICLEIWDIKSGYKTTYAQKWRVAFYAYLLEQLLNGEDFSLTVKVSDLGGLVYRHPDKERLFEREAFELLHYKTWMLRLITQWKSEASLDRFSMDFSCTSCRYFSYCYQETLFKTAPLENQKIISLGLLSNDFPRNAKQWFFIHYDHESVRWQIWYQKTSIADICIRSTDYESWNVFQETVTKYLQKEWHRAIEEGKLPHFLVYEISQWHRFQEAFQSTPLKSLWGLHSSWTSIQSVLQKHFIWPIVGRLTATQVARTLGLASDLPRPLSLYHKEPSVDFEVCRLIWNWCLSELKSSRIVSFNHQKSQAVPLIQRYSAVHHREKECRMHEILEFQKNPAPIRVQHFRAISPLFFIGTTLVDKQKSYQFSMGKDTVVSKFRQGDFLKLSPVESAQVQEGISVILEAYTPGSATLSVRPLSKKMSLNKGQAYVLDEPAEDWNALKIEKVLNRLKDPRFRPDLIQLLLGHGGREFPPTKAQWAQAWYHTQGIRLNCLQKEALMLPFSSNIGLIEGPPGSGKTHLLVWTLIALLAHARHLNCSIKILVTALTHQAIDQILLKLAKVLPSTNVGNVSIWKYGNYDHEVCTAVGIRALKHHKPLFEHSSLVLGTTGFGIYQVLEAKDFPTVFDWVVFDEASQMLPAHACLSLIFGKGNALFYGDTQQLQPILHADYEKSGYIPSSILQELIAQYPHKHRLRLNETYRMNEEICHFPSQQWYDGELRANEANRHLRLELSRYPLFSDSLDTYLDPAKPMLLVPVEHEGAQQSSEEEALWIASAVKRLIEDYAIPESEIGIISPHRLQNNCIFSVLKNTLICPSTIPKIDTVERMQGREFDVVIYSATASAKEIIHSPFLRDYRRFNVAITRARKKFLFVASPLFFQLFPSTEKELIAHRPFETFFTSMAHAAFQI